MATLLVAGCSTAPTSSYIPGSKKGGYYQDDGPHSQVPSGLKATPDAIPRIEPYRRSNSRPYHVMGKTYVPITDNRPFTERGIGSWYGKKFHGRKTASGEYYDMYKMTAAHPTLPIPSYARVTNLSNSKQVIVRINDRGPFHSGRIIDLSYTAALKLDYIQKGRERVQVDRLLPQDIRQMQAARSHTRATNQQASHVQQQKIAQHMPIESHLQRPTQLARAATQNASAASGIHLQLGVFSQKYYAETMRARYAANWAGKLPPARVVKQDAVYRLYAGPFANREFAAHAAKELQLSGMEKPMIVQR